MRFTFALATALAAIALAPANAFQPKNSSVSASQAEAERALQALADVDSDRMLKDPAYARQMLAHVEALRQSRYYRDDARIEIDRLRMIALMGSGQDDEAFAQATQLTRAAPGEVGLHYLAVLLAVHTQSDRALDELELADRSIKSEEARTRFRESLDDELVNYLRRPFFLAKDKSKIARSAQALLNFGWPGGFDLDSTDSLKLDVADHLLTQGDGEGARKLVFSIRTVRPVLRILISRRWDSTRDAGDPTERLAQAIAASDEATRLELEAKPGDPATLLRRAQFLRSIGKSEEALGLLLPKANDLAWVKEQGEDGYWVVNEAGYALLDLGRDQQAIALMQKLLSLGLRENPTLISMAINHGEILLAAGQYRQGAEHMAKLAKDHGDLASPYGDMWMWEGAACGSLLDGRPQDAAPWLSRLKAGEKDNPAALTRALLCANDLDGAAAAAIRRLNEDPDAVLLALQDYTIGSVPEGRKLIESRWREVVARPDVQEAVKKHGRILSLPLSRTYWGPF